MRLLVICINYAPELISTGVYTTGLAEWMAKEGVETDVVTALPYYPAWRVFDGWRRPWWKSRVSENGVRIAHCPIYVPSNPTGAKRILHYATFALSAFPIAMWKALRRRPDVVMMIVPSMAAAPVAWMAARSVGGTAWLHIQDYEVEAAFATGLLKEDSRIGRMAKRFEKWVLGGFDRVSSISGPMLDKLREKKVPEDRIYELRNWANLEKVRLVEGVSPMKAELGITTPYVALYSGNLANKQGLEVLPEMARLLSHRDDLTIAVCGDGPMRKGLEAMSEGIPSIRFFPLQPLDKLSDLLGMADVHLLPQIAGAADLVLPSKLTNMLASGRPVVATTPPDTALGHEVDGVGRITPPGDAAAMAAALEELLEDPQERRELGRLARLRAIERWDMDAILSRTKSEFETLSGVSSEGENKFESSRDIQ
ncbi:WcaI family glycosyltransferase [Pseudooceanicola sp. HF7]|uniref:WcaI family glycosyltransferase n=1 Tax=Pseudooceanicola sp. HF7 TaxID=2721560 RepID=UPI0014314556|nr:WcaI family glycosyltransferase [Pseudooceanicola sp. HF7]NIZ10958.1 WcaI family glycosyltransferase [Pseudooceanicola sp. HF7]